MICGSVKKKFDETSMINLREMNYMGFTINLGEFKLTFDQKNGEFKSNVNDKQIHDEKLILKRETVKKLNKKNEELANNIELIQKELLLKVSKIYALADLHAETKTDINLLIEEYDPDGSKIKEMKEIKQKAK